MERQMFICEHMKLNKLSYELLNYLKINGFESNQYKPQIECYKISNRKASFNIIIDYEDIGKESSLVQFEFCDGDKEYYLKKFNDAERLFSTEKDPEKNIGALEILLIYYDKV
jgi:hypothetical protein